MSAPRLIERDVYRATRADLDATGQIDDDVLTQRLDALAADLAALREQVARVQGEQAAVSAHRTRQREWATAQLAAAKARFVAVTDTHTTITTTAPAEHIAEAISKWYTDAPAEVVQVVRELGEAIIGRDRVGIERASAYLGVRVDEHPRRDGRDARWLDRSAVSALLAELGRPVSVQSISNYTSKPEIAPAGWPRPEGYVGRSPQWSEDAIRAYAAS